MRHASIVCALILAVMAAPRASEAAELCADYPRTIEPDMQIQETDLTVARATLAAQELKKMMPSAIHHGGLETDVVTELGMLNRLQVLEGFTLRQKALDDATGTQASRAGAAASRKDFCEWLVHKGVWYD